MINPTQINPGGAQTQEKSPKEQTGQGIVRDERGQEQPSDKRRAQQTGSRKQQSQMEGPAAYAPHDEGEKKGAN
jgi:hypothetical protein